MNWATAPCLNQQGDEVKCGGGRKTRTRTLTEAKHGGKQCHLVTSGGEQQSLFVSPQHIFNISHSSIL